MEGHLQRFYSCALAQSAVTAEKGQLYQSSATVGHADKGTMSRTHPTKTNGVRALKKLKVPT